MQVTFTRTAIKQMKKIPAADRNALVKKLKAYAKDGIGNVIKLTGREEYRLRHGNYRAIFEIKGDMIVIRVAHRKEAYD